jgi:hypothetical protein
MSIDLPKLARVLALTTSNHDGEVLSAALHARDMVKAAGLTWQQVLGGRIDTGIDIGTYRRLLAENKTLREQLARAESAAAHDPGAPRTTAEKLDVCIALTEWLNDWERDFVCNIAGWRGPLSKRQEQRLDELVSKLRRIARAQWRAA